MNRVNSPEQTHFFQTLSLGNAERIRALVTSKPELLDAYDYRSFGATPLTMACFGNRPELVRLLLELGADPNRRSDWHMGPWSPLHCAVFRRDAGLARVLLSHGAEMDVHTAAGLGDLESLPRLLDAHPSRVNEPGGDGCQPLHFADTVDVAQMLLERGADINGRCLDHYSTPVQYLCSVRPEVARYLIVAGAQTDVFSAAICGDVRAVESLLDSDSSLVQARINQTFFPPGNGHDVHNILTFTVGQECTLLHAAAKSNRPELIEPLVRRGLSVNVRGGYDEATPLHLAAWNNNIEVSAALLDHGAELDARSGKLHNNSPAGWAIVAGADGVFELLLSRGAQQLDWFLDDARAGCSGKFAQFSGATVQQRERILSRLSGQTNRPDGNLSANN